MAAALLGGSLHCAAAAAAVRAAHVQAPPAHPRAPSRPLCPHILAAATGTDAAGAGSTHQQQPAQPTLHRSTTEAHKALNAQLCAAEAADEVVRLVEQHLPAFNVINAVTAFHRIAKVGAAPRRAVG